MKNDDFNNLDRLDKVLDQDSSEVQYTKTGRKRQTVENVTHHGSQFAKGISSPKNLKNVSDQLTSVMPRASALSQELDTIESQFGDVRSQFIQEMAGVTEGVRSFTRSVLDSKRAFIPARLANRLDNFVNRGKRAEEEVIEDAREDELKAQLDSVFTASDETVAQIKSVNVHQQQLTAISKSIGKAQLATLDQISQHLSVTNRFLTGTSRNYMRKSLELQYRHLYIAKDQLTELKTMNRGFIANLEAVVKNTSLPESLKYEGLEIGKEKLTSKLYDRGISRLSDITARLFNNFRDNIINNMSSFSDLLYMGGDMLEGQSELDSLNDNTISRKAGSALGRLLSGAVGKTLGKRYSGAVDQADIHVGNVLNAISSGGRGVKLATKYTDNSVVRFISDLIDAGSTDVSVGNTLLENGTKPAVFDTRFYRSVIEIIPAYLSGIHKRLGDIYEGQPTEAHVYDITRRRLSPVSVVKQNVAEEVLGNRGVRSQGYAQSVGATMKAFKTSGLSFAADARQLEDSVGRIIANAIALKIPLLPQYMEPFFSMTSDAEITDPELLKLFKGISNKVDTGQALFFILTDAKGKPDAAAIRAINAGIYKEIRGEGFQQKLIDIIDGYGYQYLFSDELDRSGNISQDWITNQIRDLTKQNFVENYTQGEEKYVSSVKNQLSNQENINKLTNDALRLVGDRGAVTGSFNETRFSEFQRKGTSNYRKLAEFFNRDTRVDMDAFIRELERLPGEDSSKMREAFNLVQQMKIIELERQLLQQRRLASTSEEGQNEPVNLVRNPNSTPDVDWFDDDSSARRAFRLRYGTYSKEYRPYLMDVANKVIMRKTLQNIHSFLRARFTIVPTWERIRLQLLQGIVDGITALPETLVKGISNSIKSVFTAGKDLFKWAVKNPFKQIKGMTGWFGGKTLIERKEESEDSVKKIRQAAEDAANWKRLLIATEATATHTNIMVEDLAALQHNHLIGLTQDRYSARGVASAYPLKNKQSKSGYRKMLSMQSAQTGAIHTEPQRIDEKAFTRDATIWYRKNSYKDFGKEGAKIADGVANMPVEKDGKLNWFKLFSKVRLLGSLAIFGGLAAVVGKIVGSIIQKGPLQATLDMFRHLSQFLIETLPVKLGWKSPFNDAGVYKETPFDAKDRNKKVYKTGRDYKMHDYEIRSYQEDLDTGSIRAAAYKIQQTQDAYKLSGGKLKGKNWSDAKLTEEVYKELAKKAGGNRHGLTFDKEDVEILKEQLRRAGKSNAFDSLAMAVVLKQKKALFSGPIGPLPNASKRASDLEKRWEILSKKYGMPEKELRKYRARVADHTISSEDTAMFVQEFRTSRPWQSDYLKKIKGGWIKKSFTWLFKRIFTKGALNFSYYGVNQDQWNLASDLYRSGFYYELQWFLEDCHWKKYANTVGLDHFETVEDNDEKSFYTSTITAAARATSAAYATSAITAPDQLINSFTRGGRLANKVINAQQKADHAVQIAGKVAKSNLSTKLSQKLADNKAYKALEKLYKVKSKVDGVVNPKVVSSYEKAMAYATKETQALGLAAAEGSKATRRWTKMTTWTGDKIRKAATSWSKALEIMSGKQGGITGAVGRAAEKSTRVGKIASWFKNSSLYKVGATTVKAVRTFNSWMISKWSGYQKLLSVFKLAKLPGATITRILGLLKTIGKFVAKASPWIFFGGLVIGVCVGIYRWIKGQPHGFENYFKGGAVSNIFSLLMLLTSGYDIGLAFVSVLRTWFSSSNKNDTSGILSQTARAIARRTTSLHDGADAGAIDTTQGDLEKTSDQVSEKEAAAVELADTLQSTVLTIAPKENQKETEKTEQKDPKNADLEKTASADIASIESVFNEKLSTSRDIVTKQEAQRREKERAERLAIAKLAQDHTLTADQREAVRTAIDIETAKNSVKQFKETNRVAAEERRFAISMSEQLRTTADYNNVRAKIDTGNFIDAYKLMLAHDSLYAPQDQKRMREYLGLATKRQAERQAELEQKEKALTREKEIKAEMLAQYKDTANSEAVRTLYVVASQIAGYNKLNPKPEYDQLYSRVVAALLAYDYETAAKILLTDGKEFLMRSEANTIAEFLKLGGYHSETVRKRNVYAARNRRRDLPKENGDRYIAQLQPYLQTIQKKDSETYAQLIEYINAEDLYAVVNRMQRWADNRNDTIMSDAVYRVYVEIANEIANGPITAEMRSQFQQNWNALQKTDDSVTVVNEIPPERSSEVEARTIKMIPAPITSLKSTPKTTQLTPAEVVEKLTREAAEWDPRTPVIKGAPSNTTSDGSFNHPLTFDKNDPLSSLLQPTAELTKAATALQNATQNVSGQYVNLKEFGTDLRSIGALIETQQQTNLAILQYLKEARQEIRNSNSSQNLNSLSIDVKKRTYGD